jgi:hypothetical protein
MKKSRSEIFSEWADDFEARSKAPSDKDHPKWLAAAARDFRKRAARKEKALAHKQRQKRKTDS